MPAANGSTTDCRRGGFEGMTEQQIQQQIRLACSSGDTRLFRNNTGTLRDQHGPPEPIRHYSIAPITMYRSLCLFTAWAAIICGLSGAFAWCVRTSLDDMTRADCQAGQVRACAALSIR
jgi:hypothetical protein